MPDSTTLWHFVLLLFAAYLLGSIRTAYLAARLLRGVDIREYGTGNVGGNNAGAIIGPRARIVVGLLDIAKVGLPTSLVFGPMDLGYAAAVLTVLAGTVGHNWSIFVGFTGGRGISGILATLVVVFPWGALSLLLFMFASWRLGSTVGSTIGLITRPLLSLLLICRPPSPWAVWP